MLSEGRNIRNVISRDLNGGLERRADELWEGENEFIMAIGAKFTRQQTLCG